MNRIKDVSLYLVAGFFLAGVSSVLKSDFLHDYLSKNLITLLVALLAINITTNSVLLTRLKEMLDGHGLSFADTVRELKFAIYEQIVLIVIGGLLLIGSGSRWLIADGAIARLLLNGLIAAVFVGGLLVLFDTAKAAFLLVNFDHQNGAQEVKGNVRDRRTTASGERSAREWEEHDV